MIIWYRCPILFPVRLFHQLQFQIDFLFRIHQIQTVGIQIRCISELRIEVNDRLSGTSFLGGNHNHTVGGTGTVDSGSRRIFQDSDTFDIVRTQSGNRRLCHVGNVVVVICIQGRNIGSLQRHTVQHPKRVLRSAQRSRTTDTDTCRRARCSGSIGHRYAGYLSGQGLVDTFYSGYHSIRNLYLRNGSRQFTAFQLLVTGYHHIAQGMRRDLQHNAVSVFSPLQSYRLFFITYIATKQFSYFFGYGKRKVSVHISNGS